MAELRTEKREGLLLLLVALQAEGVPDGAHAEGANGEGPGAGRADGGDEWGGHGSVLLLDGALASPVILTAYFSHS